MSRRFTNLPPLNSMAAFEAAGRHLNFSAAAKELGTTQPAISQQIGFLEADLGTPLFLRQHRGVALTAEGGRLLTAVTGGLRMIEDAAVAIRRDAGPKILKILTDFGFAAWWLMPRLGTLSTRMPDADVRILTAQQGVDFRREGVDVAVLFGARDHWPGCHVTPLFPEAVYPVCGRDYLTAANRPVDAADLRRMRLLHLGGGAASGGWLSWSDWFAARGEVLGPRNHDLTFNNYQLALQAALLGQGVALGWSPLIDDLVAGGALIRLDDRPLTSSRGYHLIEPLPQVAEPIVAHFRNWLMEERGRVIEDFHH